MSVLIYKHIVWHSSSRVPVFMQRLLLPDSTRELENARVQTRPCPPIVADEGRHKT